MAPNTSEGNLQEIKDKEKLSAQAHAGSVCTQKQPFACVCVLISAEWKLTQIKRKTCFNLSREAATYLSAVPDLTLTLFIADAKCWNTCNTLWVPSVLCTTGIKSTNLLTKSVQGWKMGFFFQNVLKTTTFRNQLIQAPVRQWKFHIKQNTFDTVQPFLIHDNSAPEMTNFWKPVPEHNLSKTQLSFWLCGEGTWWSQTQLCAGVLWYVIILPTTSPACILQRFQLLWCILKMQRKDLSIFSSFRLN